MSKIAKYLREHLDGEVITSAAEREHYSVDASIFQAVPELIVHPANTDDVRKLARLSSQLAERGKKLPITPRGAGTDQSGAAIGHGIVLNFPAHMNRLLELDTGKNFCVAEPGMMYGALQSTLISHGRFLPAYPASGDYSTIGGAVANNAAGPRTVKYGATKAFVRELEVVLSNGELITTKRLSKHELNRKKGLTNMEGEIYRELDGLISDNESLIQQTKLDITKNTAGYNLADVRGKGGSFDLTPLFVGAQGTLGIITKAKFRIVAHRPKTTMALAMFSGYQPALEVVPEILKLGPSMLEFVDGGMLEIIRGSHRGSLKDVFGDELPGAVLLIEFDDENRRIQQRKAKQLAKTLTHFASEVQISDKQDEKEAFWRVRRSVSLLPGDTTNKKEILPVLNDAVVPPDKLPQTVEFLSDLAKKHHLNLPIFAHAGDGNIHISPMFNLASVGDRQKLFKLSDGYYKFVVEQGGSTSGQLGDGRLRAPYLPSLYGPDVYQLFCDVKKIFDPFDVLNPGVKIDVSQEDQIAMMRETVPQNPRFTHHLPYS